MNDANFPECLTNYLSDISIQKRHHYETLISSQHLIGNWIISIGSGMLASAFLNRWLVVGVPLGWKWVSQVLFALHVTLLRGGIGGRVGRECSSVKVHYSFRPAQRPRLQPHRSWSHTRI